MTVAWAKYAAFAHIINTLHIRTEYQATATMNLAKQPAMFTLPHNEADWANDRTRL